MIPRNVAVVTGGSRGIGRGCAIEFARQGFDVAVCARTLREGQSFEHSLSVRRSKITPLPGSLEKTAAEIEALGGRALPLAFDLMSRRTLDLVVERVLAVWGRIDVLVQAARYVGPGTRDEFVDTPFSYLDAFTQCNVLSPVLDQADDPDDDQAGWRGRH